MVAAQGKNWSKPRGATGTLVSDVLVSDVTSEPVFNTKTDASFFASPLNSKTKPSSARKKELPRTFRPDPSNEQFARSSGLDLEDELAAFADLHGSLGNRRSNWQAVFRKHLINAAADHGRIAVPTWMPLEYWHEYLKMRRNLGKGIRPEQQRLLVKKLAEFRLLGDSPAVILAQSTEEGWAGLYPPNRKNRNRSIINWPNAADVLKRQREG